MDNLGQRCGISRAEGLNCKEPFDCYIIDWVMPQMDGIETVRRIRSFIGNDTPVIIITAYDWTDIEEQAKEAGVTAFCNKPIFMSDLRSVLVQANNIAVKDNKQEISEKIDFHNCRVLIVEDNELNLEIADEIMKNNGFITEHASDGSVAVEMVKNSEEGYYDLILMDIQMPIMDGYEATRTIRSLERKDVAEMPIIAMTANAFEDDKKRALKNGMNEHLAKPIDIDKLIQILNRLFSKGISVVPDSDK